MKKQYFLILFAIFLCSANGYASIPGDYEVQIPFSPPLAHSLDQVTMHVVFAFDCPHCYNFHRDQETALKRKFGDKLKIVLQPIGWRGPDPGRLYFIAEEKGKGEAVLMMIFDFLFNKGLGTEMFKRDKLAFVARLNGLEEEFKTLMDHPRIVQKMKESMRFADDRKINSTPTVVIEKVMFPERNYGNLVTIINGLLKEPVE